MQTRGLEPLRQPVLGTNRCPSYPLSANLAVLGGNDPHSYGVTSRRASMNTLRPILGSGGGNRTPTNGFGDRRTAIILHRNYLASRTGFEPVCSP
jgi:hypothetical protein